MTEEINQEKMENATDTTESKDTSDDSNAVTNSISLNNGEHAPEDEQEQMAVEEPSNDVQKGETESEKPETLNRTDSVDGDSTDKQPSAVISEESTTAKDAESERPMEEPAADAESKPVARGRGRPKGKQGSGGGRGKAKATESDSGKETATSSEQKQEESKAESGRKVNRKRGAVKETEMESDEDGEDRKKPLLETPLIIEGKRQRQQVERLDAKMLATPLHPKDVDLPQGSGTKLADIPFIDAMITKTMADDLKPLHRLCFGRAGQSHEVRKNLRSFCGFDFGKDTEGYTRKLKQMESWTMKNLKKICEVLGLERSHKKDELQREIMDFVMKPVDAGKKVPQATKRKSSVGGNKKKKSRASSSASGGKKGGSDKELTATSESDEESEKESESGGKRKGGSVSKEEPKAKKAKKSPAKKESTSSSVNKKSGKSGTKSSKEPPTDDDIRETLKDLLDGANLEEITMRDMCRKIYAKYPEFDLTTRKDFIKDTVKSIIASPGE